MLPICVAMLWHIVVVIVAYVNEYDWRWGAHVRLPRRCYCLLCARKFFIAIMKCPHSKSEVAQGLRRVTGTFFN